jgi:hypothetical protein
MRRAAAAGAPIEESISPVELTSRDILCCGKSNKHSMGCLANRRFRFLIMLNIERFKGIARKAKGIVAKSIFDQIKNGGGRFLTRVVQQEQQQAENTAYFFVEISEEKARTKIGQALRDGLRVPRKYGSQDAMFAIKTELRKRYGSKNFHWRANECLLQLDLSDKEKLLGNVNVTPGAAELIVLVEQAFIARIKSRLLSRKKEETPASPPGSPPEQILGTFS